MSVLPFQPRCNRGNRQWQRYSPIDPYLLRDYECILWSIITGCEAEKAHVEDGLIFEYLADLDVEGYIGLTYRYESCGQESQSQNRYGFHCSVVLVRSIADAYNQPVVMLGNDIESLALVRCNLRKFDIQGQTKSISLRSLDSFAFERAFRLRRTCI